MYIKPSLSVGGVFKKRGGGERGDVITMINTPGELLYGAHSSPCLHQVVEMVQLYMTL